MNSSRHLQSLLDDFILLDCRLGNHPSLIANVYFLDGESLRPVATTGSVDKISREVSAFPETGETVKTWQSNRIIIGDRKKQVLSASSALRDVDYSQFMRVPISGDSGLIGVLSIQGDEAIDLQKCVGHAQLLAALLAYCHTHLGKRIRNRTPFSMTLGTALTETRHEMGLTQERLAEIVGTSRISVSRWEAGAQPPTIGPLRRWCEALGLLADGEPGITSVVELPQQFITLLRNDPKELSKLSAEQFERFVAERLDRMGYDVKLTGPTSLKDGGIDLIAVPKLPTVGSILLAGQIKHHSTQRKTGREAVDRLLAWKDSPFRLGLLVTNTSFTRDALWVASQDRGKNFLRLRDFEDLKRWLHDHFWSEEDWREIPKEVTLSPGVVVRVPQPTFNFARRIWPFDIVQAEKHPK